MANVAMGQEGTSTDFDCNICLDRVKEPVVTLCGHLYCWPCLYRWVSNHNECPVCKAGVTKENVIPVYGRGANPIDPRQICPRPRGQRPEPVLRRRHPQEAEFAPLPQDAAISPIIGFFPSLFGLQLQSAATATATGDTIGPVTQSEMQQRLQHAFLSRLLLIMAFIVLL